MKKIVLISSLVLGVFTVQAIPFSANNLEKSTIIGDEKFDIKIKNDTGNEVKVINAGSGGSYNLAKNTVTTIKMEEGDKLHYYEKGKKGALILTATKDMHGKVQLLSKI